MGMSTRVMGFRPPDEKWKKMKAVYDACIKACVEIPDEVWNFFECRHPDDDGIEVEFEDGVVEHKVVDTTVVYEVTLANVPDNVTVIRFENSW
jgi:hypothetical protein